jgi:pimeloyl-ACP methyl ester carboxylesterase
MLFHGIRANRQQTLSRTAFLVRAGYRCVAFDHRAHGESHGKRTSFGYYEGRDVVSVRQLVRERWPHQPCAALGISMGAAAVCFAASHLGQLDAVILESLYHDIESTFTNRINTTYPTWIGRLSRGIFWVTERRLGLQRWQLAPAHHIGALGSSPVLLVTGTHDLHAPPTEARRLLERCRGPRDLWLVPQAQHKDVFEKGGVLYQQRILDFLDRWLPVSQGK